jgi:hypothetical protein
MGTLETFVIYASFSFIIIYICLKYSKMLKRFDSNIELQHNMIKYMLEERKKLFYDLYSQGLMGISEDKLKQIQEILNRPDNIDKKQELH